MEPAKENQNQGAEVQESPQASSEAEVTGQAELQLVAQNDQRAEAAAREAEEEEVTGIHRRLEGVESRESRDLQTPPSQLYEEILKPHLTEIVKAWGLDSAIQTAQAKLAQAKERGSVKVEKKVVRTLMHAFKEVPSEKWAFFPGKMAEGVANNSAMTLVFGHILKDQLGMQVMQTNPWRHTANIVTYSDGSTQYVDARNQITRDIRFDEPRQEIDGFKVYEVKVPKLEYRLLPVAELDHAAALTYLENINELVKRKGHDPNAAAALEHSDIVPDVEFAQKYMQDKFLHIREDDPVWLDEKNALDERRGYQSIPIFGRFF